MQERCFAAEQAVAIQARQQRAAELIQRRPVSPLKDAELMAEVQSLQQQVCTILLHIPVLPAEACSPQPHTDRWLVVRLLCICCMTVVQL